MERLTVGAAEVHVLGTLHGLTAQAARVEEAFRRLAPDAVGVGVAPAELDALLVHLGLAPAPAADEDDEEEGDVLDPSEWYARGLSRFGEIATPPPDLLAAVSLARAAGVEPVALDLDETQYGDVFTANVGPFALFRYGRRVRKLARKPPAGESAEAFARAWDARIRALKGFDAVERARERHMALRIEALAGAGGRVLAVVDLTRAEGVVRELRARNG